MSGQAMTRVPGASLPPAFGQLASVLGMGLALVAGGWLAAESEPETVDQRAVVASSALRRAAAPVAATTQVPAPSVSPAPPASAAPAAAAPEPAAPEPADRAAVTPAPAAQPEPAARPAVAAGPCVLLRAGFGANTAWLAPPVVAQVEAAGRWLARTGGPVAVRGFADASGAMDHNLKLSHKRATLVRDVLARVGVARARMTVQALGAYAPLTGVAADDGRNRRVELWLPEGGCPPALTEEDR